MERSRLVGRQAELDALANTFRKSASSRAQLVVVTGEAGIGKTRLIQEHLSRPATRDAMLLVGGSQPDLGVAVPYGPLVEAFRNIPDDVDFRQWLSDPANDGLAPLMPLWYGAITPLKLSPGRLLESCLRLLRELARRRDTVLVLEDLHWSDAATVKVLTFLIRNLSGENLQLILTFRNDELPPEHILHTFLSVAVRQPELTRLDLAGLSEAETEILLQQHLPAVPDERRKAIQLRGDGNPFLLEQLCSSSGRLPDSLRDHVIDRMRVLPAEAKHALSIVAANGGSLPFALMDQCAVTDDAVRLVVGSGLIEVDDDNETLRFRHAVLNALVYEAMLPTERKRIHTELAQAILWSSGQMTPETAAVVAQHWLRASRPVDALKPIILAANSAAARFAYVDADHLYGQALQLWNKVDDAERLTGSSRSELLLQRAESARWTDQLDRAIALAEEALMALPSQGGHLLESAAWERLARYRWETGHGDGALVAARRSTAVLDGHGSTQQSARAAAALAALLMVRGNFVDSLPIAREAVSMARTAGAVREQSYALNTAGVANASIGNIDAGLTDLRESLRLAKSAGALEDVGRAYVNLAYVLDLAYRLNEAVDIALEGLRFTRRFGFEHSAGRLLTPNAVSTLKTLGRWPEAYQLLANVTGDIPRGHQVYLDLVRADLDLVTGRPVDDSMLDALEPVVRKMEELWATGLLAICRAQAAMWKRNYSTALALATEPIRTLGDAGEDQLVARLTALALGALADQASPAAGPPAAQAHAEELITGLAGLRDQPSCRPTVVLCDAERRRLVDPADDALWASMVTDPTVVQQPYLVAYALFRLAETCHHSHSSDTAIAIENAMAAAAGLGAEPLAGWIRALATRARHPSVSAKSASPTEGAWNLTPREQQVLQHLVDGASTRAIARSLYISERTVGVHVGNILRKLGVVSRAEAVARVAKLLP